MKNWKKSKVVMLPTEKASNVFRDDNGILRYSLTPLSKTGTSLDRFWSQHLYITNPNEEIKEGDWVYNSHPYTKQPIMRVIKDIIGLVYHDIGKIHWSKIIASTDESLKVISHFETNPDNTGSGAIMKSLPRPSDEFLKKYCELGGINEVMVEYEEDTYSIGIKDYKEEGYWKLKVAPDNTITIKPVKNSWSREEVKNLLKRAFGRAKSTGCYLDRDQVSNWIKENL